MQQLRQFYPVSYIILYHNIHDFSISLLLVSEGVSKIRGRPLHFYPLYHLRIAFTVAFITGYATGEDVRSGCVPI